MLDSSSAMLTMLHRGLSFNDVLLVPRYSSLESRTEPDISAQFGSMKLTAPIISAPMDTVTEANMASFMWQSGGLGIIHRYNSVSQQYSHIKWVTNIGERCGAAVGINGDSWERTVAAVEAGADAIVLDIAHGHSAAAIQRAEKIREEFPSVILMSPNVATYSAATDYINVGVDALRVGVGPGSACTTRLVAGVGVPQLTAISWTRHAIDNSKKDVSLVADGGVKNSGDVVKALAAGADAVMLGGFLAPFEVAAGPRRFVEVETDSPVEELFDTDSYTRTVMVKQFRGMASKEALGEYKKGERFFPEGETFEIPIVYNYREVMNELRDGIYTGFSYLGARNIRELRNNAAFIQVSSAGYFEGTPHHGTIYGG